MRAACSVWESVGGTALLKIQSLSELTGCEIFGKAEFLNPGGSIKDRAAKAMLADAESKGMLAAGGTIVEGTAGNTGIGLAILAAERGYRVILTMPNNQAQEKYQLLKALGAEVVAVPPCPFADLGHFYHRAREIAASIPGAFWANQFENLSNAAAHYQSTAPEIWTQMAGRVDVLLSAVGTGGTIAGCSQFLKEQDASVRVVVVDPPGSGVYDYVHFGTMTGEGSSVTEGIGIKRVTANFARARVDDALRITDREMIDTLFHVAKYDGLFLGTSSALNLAGALRYGREKGPGLRIVTFLCDSGTRYASKLLDERWQKEWHLEPRSLGGEVV